MVCRTCPHRYPEDVDLCKYCDGHGNIEYDTQEWDENAEYDALCDRYYPLTAVEILEERHGKL